MINIAKFEEYYLFNALYMKLCSRTKCSQVTLRFNCHNNSLFFFKKESVIFRFVIQSDHATFIYQVPSTHIVFIFSANIFFLHFHFSKQFIFTFQTPSFQYFSFTHPRLQKNNGSSLNHRRDWLKKWIKTIKFNSL